MSHDHSHHHHDHSVQLTHLNKAFIIGIVFNLLFVVIEVVAGLIIHSLSLLSDAGHNLADVGALALSLLAFKLVKVKSTRQFTYGYRKTSILVALFNAAVLFISIGAIVYEAIHRLLNPEPVPGTTIAIIAGIGIVINATTALFFFRDKEKDMNVRSAYLHLMSDALVSLALVIGGIIIYYTGWYWVDSALGILVALAILFSTWSLLKESLRMSLDAVPKNINLEDVKTLALQIPGVSDFYHIHIWAISTTENALTGHLILKKDVDLDQESKIKSHLKHELLHMNIHHVTIETEWENQTVPNLPC